MPAIRLSISAVLTSVASPIHGLLPHRNKSTIFRAVALIVVFTVNGALSIRCILIVTIFYCPLFKYNKIMPFFAYRDSPSSVVAISVTVRFSHRSFMLLQTEYRREYSGVILEQAPCFLVDAPFLLLTSSCKHPQLCINPLLNELLLLSLYFHKRNGNSI